MIIQIRGTKTHSIRQGHHGRSTEKGEYILGVEATGFEKITFSQSITVRTGNEALVSVPGGARCTGSLSLHQHPIAQESLAYDMGQARSGRQIYACPTHYNQLMTEEQLHQKILNDRFIIQAQAVEIDSDVVRWEKPRSQ